MAAQLCGSPSSHLVTTSCLGTVFVHQEVGWDDSLSGVLVHLSEVVGILLAACALHSGLGVTVC